MSNRQSHLREWADWVEARRGFLEDLDVGWWKNQGLWVDLAPPDHALQRGVAFRLPSLEPPPNLPCDSVRETLQALSYPTLPAYKMAASDLADVKAWAAGLSDWCDEQVRPAERCRWG